MSAFDKRASQWDTKSRRVMLARDVVSAVEKYAGPEKGMDIADFGTGTGLVLLGMAEYAGTLTGYDSSDGMLQVLAEKGAEAGLTGLQTVRLDIDTDEFPPESADIMTASMVAHHLEDPKVLMKKAYKALRKGGRLCISDLKKSDEPFHDDAQADVKHQGFDTEEIKKWMLESGFSAAEVHDASVVRKERGGRHLEFGIFLAVGVK